MCHSDRGNVRGQTGSASFGMFGAKPFASLGGELALSACGDSDGGAA